MKFCLNRILAPLAILIGCSITGWAWGQTAGQLSAAREALKGVPPSDIPAKAVQLVSAAAAKDRAAVAAAVGRAVASTSPQWATAVVTAVATKEPKMAGAVAGGAAAVLPGSAKSIAVAAAKAPGVEISDVRVVVIGSAPAHAVEVVLALHDLQLRKP